MGLQSLSSALRNVRVKSFSLSDEESWEFNPTIYSKQGNTRQHSPQLAHNSEGLLLSLHGLGNMGDTFRKPSDASIPMSLGTCTMQHTLFLIIGIDLIYLNIVRAIIS